MKQWKKGLIVTLLWVAIFSSVGYIIIQGSSNSDASIYLPGYRVGEVTLSYYDGNWTAKVIGTKIEYSNANFTSVIEWIENNTICVK